MCYTYAPHTYWSGLCTDLYNNDKCTTSQFYSLNNKFGNAGCLVVMDGEWCWGCGLSHQCWFQMVQEWLAQKSSSFSVSPACCVIPTYISRYVAVGATSSMGYLYCTLLLSPHAPISPAPFSLHCVQQSDNTWAMHDRGRYQWPLRLGTKEQPPTHCYFSQACPTMFYIHLKHTYVTK